MGLYPVKKEDIIRFNVVAIDRPSGRKEGMEDAGDSARAQHIRGT